MGRRLDILPRRAIAELMPNLATPAIARDFAAAILNRSLSGRRDAELQLSDRNTRACALGPSTLPMQPVNERLAARRFAGDIAAALTSLNDAPSPAANSEPTAGDS